jgi:ribosome-binding factor A
MLNYKRADRIGDQIRAEIADILVRKIKDPDIGFVTVTAVEVTDDLRHAKVFVSTLESESMTSPARRGGPERAQRKTLQGLVRASGFIRAELGKRLRLKFIPQLSFHLDQSAQKAAHILQLLEEIKQADHGHQ